MIVTEPFDWYIISMLCVRSAAEAREALGLQDDSVPNRALSLRARHGGT